MAGNKKKQKSELDSLKAELTSLSEAVWALRERLTVQAAADAARESATRGPAAADGRSAGAGVAARVERVHATGEAGLIRTYGYYETGDRGYRWAREAVPVTDLLALDDARAAQLLSALGHRQRLAILKAVLDRPRSAVDLVDLLNLGTTGAAYHHLNVLQAVDLVVQESRGVFAIHAQRVQGLLILLAGIADMLDPAPESAPVDLAESGATTQDGAG